MPSHAWRSTTDQFLMGELENQRRSDASVQGY
jgi:hypothetical protein